jgi:cobyrinic acid a,c-diamide synthase
MDPIDLEPRYSTHYHTGRCLRCLAQEELNNCIVAMLGSVEDEDSNKLQAKYSALVAFLESPEAQALIDETEEYLSEGRKVSVKLNFENDKLEYKVIAE